MRGFWHSSVTHLMVNYSFWLLCFPKISLFCLEWQISPHCKVKPISRKTCDTLIMDPIPRTVDTFSDRHLRHSRQSTVTRKKKGLGTKLDQGPQIGTRIRLLWPQPQRQSAPLVGPQGQHSRCLESVVPRALAKKMYETWLYANINMFSSHVHYSEFSNVCIYLYMYMI